MKKITLILISAAFLATGTITSCSSNNSETEKQGKEYTAAYICPMHCEGSGSDQAGTCPVCKMNYVKNEDHKADGHTH